MESFTEWIKTLDASNTATVGMITSLSLTGIVVLLVRVIKGWSIPVVVMFLWYAMYISVK